MSQQVLDAAIIGCREALKLGLVWYACRSFFYAYDRKALMRYFYIGVAVASGLFVLSFFIPHDMAMREIVSRSVGYVFFLFFMISLALMFDPPVLRPGIVVLEPVVVVVAAALYFSPDVVGASLFVREVAVLAGAGSLAGVYLLGAVVFAGTLLLFYLVFRKPFKNAGLYFGLAELFIFLCLVKFLGGGTKGFAELSLVSSVQQGLLKFVHDAVHQSLIFIMVPDHPLLVTTTWNFIGFFFGDIFSSFLALLILAGPMVLYLYYSLFATIPLPEGTHAGAEGRMYLAGQRAHRRRRSVMAAAFAFVVFVSWYTVGGGQAGSDLQLPEPRPLVAERGVLAIPLSGPGADLLDGGLHKFSVALEDETVYLMVIRKPDGKLAVALDACEICPPEGYGKSGEHLVCVYCMTPIPIETLGKPGGCNPIPLEVEIGDTFIQVRMDEIAGKWARIGSGLSREGAR